MTGHYHGGGTLGAIRTDALYTYRAVNWDPIVGGVQNFQVKGETYAGCTDTKTLK